MKKISLMLLTTAISLFANTETINVNLDIYTNKAFINKVYMLKQTGEITTKVPVNLSLEMIRYKIDDQCQVNSNNLTNTLKKINPDMKNLREQKVKINHEIKALEAKITLLKTLSLEKIDNFSKIDKISSYLSKNLIENLTLIANLKKEILQIDEKLKGIDGIKEQYKELKTVYTCNKTNKKLEISYPQKGIKYTPFYNISANINNKSLTIEKKATLFYKGAENFENIDLNIYSYTYDQNVAPQYFYPEYLGQKREVMYKKEAMAMDSIQKSVTSGARMQHHELATKSLYKIHDIRLKANEKNLLHVDKEILDASFKTIIDAYGSNKAYMEASIKTKKDYSSAQANYFLNQNPIASRYMGRLKKDTQTKIYFGEDEHIQIKKELIQTLDEKSFFGDKKVSTQNWKYTITNKKIYATDIEFITRVPVSKNADIKVRTLAKPKFDSQSAKGKTVWNLHINPNAKEEIIFGYEISDDK